MLNDRRRFWTTLIFILLLAPAVVTLLLTLLTPAPHAGQPPAGGSNNTNPLTAILPPASPVAPVGAPASAPLLAGSDGRHVWVVHPFLLQERDPATGNAKQSPVYELLRRTGNTGVWMRSTNFAALWRNFPQSMTVMPLPSGDGAAGRPFVPGMPFVFNEGGSVDRYTIDTQGTAESLPAGHTVKASAGSLQGVFALTLGPAPAAATRPGDPLRPSIDVYSSFDPLAPMLPRRGAPAISEGPETAPAIATTSAATAPETRPGPPAFINAFWLRNNRWVLLPSLGQPLNEPAVAPTAESRVALVAQDEAAGTSTLYALWVDPTRPGDLFVRTLPLGTSLAESAWSPAARCPLPEQLPAVTRLLAVPIDGKTGVFWTVPTGATVELRGGVLVPQGAATTASSRPTAFTFNANRVAPMSLGPAGQGIRPDLDVALGVSENSLIAVVATKDNPADARKPGLATLAFSDRGLLMAGPTPVQPRSMAADVQIGRNIGMIILMLIFSLSLWQWRQGPAPLAIPAGLVPAPLHLRAIAFLIDAAIPFLLVAIAFGELGNATSMLSAWFGSSARPEELLHLPEFFTFIALYISHCTVGELFFRRTIGKALTGLQVLMIDGKPPTLAAVILRNLVRLPELGIGFIFIWMLVSEQRQRVGDLLARTLVLSKALPEVPGDGDDAPPSPPRKG
jgi:uncharacterized RDD family membrane protein YckC